MGLDQYAYTIDADENVTIEGIQKLFNESCGKSIGEWRKHPNLEGWMATLWHTRQQETILDGIVNERLPRNTAQNYPKKFNCELLELFTSDINRLADDITGDNLDEHSGYFFGSNKDLYYKESDIKFIQAARKEIDSGNRVFYTSWW